MICDADVAGPALRERTANALIISTRKPVVAIGVATAFGETNPLFVMPNAHVAILIIGTFFAARASLETLIVETDLVGRAFCDIPTTAFVVLAGKTPRAIATTPTAGGTSTQSRARGNVAILSRWAFLRFTASNLTFVVDAALRYRA